MPIYDYKCRKCGELFESFRSISDSDSDVECPKCGSKNPDRLFGRVFGIRPTGGSCGPRFSGG